MNELKIKFHNFPYSLNRTHFIARFGKTPTRIKTNEFRKWEHKNLVDLVDQHDVIKKFKESLSEQDCFRLEIVFKIKQERFFKKTKAKNSNPINKRAGDLSNLIKPIEDQVFNFLEVDDGRVVEIYAKKTASIENEIEVTIQKVTVSRAS